MLEIKTDGLKPIGMGVSGEIFLFDEDKVLKVFRESYALPQVERAFKIAEYVYGCGIPVPKTYEIVSCGGRYGIISEFINAPSLQIAIYNGEADRTDAGKKMGSLLKQIHSLKRAEFIPTQKEMAAEIYDRIGGLMSDDAKKKCLDFLDSFPGKDHVLHGDFHENNIMYRNGEFVLIDLDSLCIGSPLFEFQQTFTVYRADIPEDWKEKVHYSDKEAEDFLDAFLESYFGTSDRRVTDEYKRIFSSICRVNMFAAKLLQSPPEMFDETKAFAEKEFPQIERLIAEIPAEFSKLPW